MITYILVASVGLWMAFVMSMKFMTPARAQQAPDSGELPAEFTASPPSIPPPPPVIPSVTGQEVDDESAGSPMDVIFKSDYVYDPTGKRDPFRPFKALGTGAVKSGKSTEASEPLQKWEIDRLQVVGILWDVAKPKAMIKDPDGVVYTASIKTKIGRNDGFIAAIREGEVVVIEVTYYEDGRTIQEPRIMELKK